MREGRSSDQQQQKPNEAVDESISAPPKSAEGETEASGAADAAENQHSHQKVVSPNNNKLPKALAAVATILAIGAVAAYLEVLPGYWNDAHDHFATQYLLRDCGSTLLTGALGYAFVQLNTWAVAREILEPRDARKVIHTCSAPLFILFWPLYSPVPAARVIAALVPLLNAVRLVRAANGSTSQAAAASDESALAAAVSRSGDAREAVGGPLIYVCVLAAACLLFWRDSPVGVTAVSVLAAGDGMADLVGRRYGRNNQWPWGRDNKSVAGTLAFWVASTVVTTGLLVWLQYTGCLVLSGGGWTDTAATVAGISLVSAILEVVPSLGDDNYTVPLSAAVLAILFLR